MVKHFAHKKTGLWRCKHMNAFYGKFWKLCHICHIDSSWSVHWSVSLRGSEVNRANELAKIVWQRTAVFLTLFCWSCVTCGKRIHKFRVNCLRDTTDVGSAHSLLTRYFSSTWSIRFSFIPLVSSQIFTLLQVGKLLRENWAVKLLWAVQF